MTRTTEVPSVTLNNGIQMPLLGFAILFTIGVLTPMSAQTISIARRESLPSRQGPAENFTGSVRVDTPFGPNTPSRTSGALVAFEPGARSAWHTHPLGQTLIVTAGTGRVQQWGSPADEIRQGDVVWIPPNTKHWHGAAPHASMTHVAIVEQLDGKSTEWMEHVTDEQYNAPFRNQRPAASNEPTAAQRAIGDISPKLVELTDACCSVTCGNARSSPNAIGVSSPSVRSLQ